MKTEEARKIIQYFEIAEEEREGKYYKEYRTLKIENSCIKMENNGIFESSISSGRIWNFFVKAILLNESELMKMAIQMEQSDYANIEQAAKEAAMEFATGMKLKISNE